ncbi:helix-turn-helix domain-containing protein [Arthrobacter sp. zg-Y1219]|uniref:helix-turn-helix domain-containing protein n=1 Tax=Arthrobacter sp. zg-Y1219 TaxID=3049067 RepID=UPI0024C3D2CC|nr:helix-turn-helix domain-containing protein [Arthrobacter sp. zg-Y1219]MDK1359652.1 helix-turn-helix domain-containing protein [Arthrobacter sp. zg-Y1219]
MRGGLCRLWNPSGRDDPKVQPLLTPAQVAVQLNVDTATVGELIARGDLRALLISPGGQWRIAANDLSEYIEQAYKTADEVIKILDPLNEWLELQRTAVSTSQHGRRHGPSSTVVP